MPDSPVAPAAPAAAAARFPATAFLIFTCAAHGAVHVLDTVLAPMQGRLTAEFGLANNEAFGDLNVAMHLLFGFGGLLIAALGHRVQSKWFLIAYVAGSTAMCAVLPFAATLTTFLMGLAVLGTLMSWYHPAGVALLATHAPNRAHALAMHGVAGQIGLAGGPLLGALGNAVGWRWSFWAAAVLYLTITVGIASIVMRRSFPRDHDDASEAARKSGNGAGARDRHFTSGLILFGLITAVAGIVYRGFITFFPKYVGSTGGSVDYALTFALAAGIPGQIAGGWLAHRFSLEKSFLAVATVSAVLMVLIGAVGGGWAILPAAAFTFVYFMVQPVGNVLVATYTEPRWRSTWYALHFSFGFGVGSLGSKLAGWVADNHSLSAIYPVLGGVMAVAAVLTAVLVFAARKRAL